MAERTPATPRTLHVAQIGAGSIEIPPRGYGAVEEYVANLSSGLRALGHSVEILNRIPPVRGSRARELLSAVTLPLDLGRRTFDIVHAHTPLTAESLTASRHPYVLTSHSRHWLGAAGTLDVLRRRRDEMAVRVAIGVIALAPQTLRRFRDLRRDRSPDSSVEYIPFGVDPDRFQPLPPGSPRSGVVGLGVVAAHKRFDILAASARAAGAGARILGRVSSEPLRAELKGRNPALEFLGEVSADALPGLLASAKVLVHPSDSELASVATIQAMACGLPVVGSDLLEGLVTEGKEGFLVDHRKPFEERVAATAEAIERLLGNETLWSRMSENARRTAVENHAWSEIAQRVAAFYARILDAASKTR
ncbi:MAG: glycosyltransferase family 4 protein [Thermoplasmata archaeon]|nr:glycosyltransferase family 4 protein [Thermoplasmata archaeon]